jgi:SNF2 family DNA or RNA helicase
VRVDLDKRAYPKQHRTIKQISEAAQIILDSGETMTIMHLIALITRKRQANVWPGGIVMRDKEGTILFDAGTEIQESVKLDEALEYIKEEHSLGNRQVVFSQFKTGLREFQRRIQAEGIRAARFDGDTPDELREEIKNNFYAALAEEPKWDVVLANYKTGGSGLNLTAATVTHVIDEEWNPGKKRQAYARTHRMGQTKETRVYRYLIPASIDTWMSNTIKRKQDIIDGFNGSMKQVEGMAEDLKLALLNGDIL